MWCCSRKRKSASTVLVDEAKEQSFFFLSIIAKLGKFSPTFQINLKQIQQTKSAASGVGTDSLSGKNALRLIIALIRVQLARESICVPGNKCGSDFNPPLRQKQFRFWCHLRPL